MKWNGSEEEIGAKMQQSPQMGKPMPKPRKNQTGDNTSSVNGGKVTATEVTVQSEMLINVVFSQPIEVMTTDVFGNRGLPALLLAIRNGIALVEIGNAWTVRSLNEVQGIRKKQKEKLV